MSRSSEDAGRQGNTLQPWIFTFTRNVCQRSTLYIKRECVLLACLPPPLLLPLACC